MITFWSLLKESVIVQAMLTLGYAAVIGYLIVVGKPVSTEAWGAFSLLIGFWFGSKQKFDGSRKE